MAILHVVRGRVAAVTATDHGGIRSEVDRHPPVEDVERPLPQAGIAELLSVAGDAAVELVDLAEPTLDHQAREHLAADAAGAVCDDRLVLEVVVCAAVQLGDELTGVADRRDHSIREPADFRLERVTPVEEGDLLLGAQFVQLLRAQPNATADYAVLIDLELAGRTEADELVANADAQSWEIVAAAIAPLAVEVLERGILARLSQVLL